MKFISLFESITHANLEDAFQIEETIYFIVKEGMMGLAVGKHGSNFRHIEGLLKRNVRIIEYSTDLSKFVQNVIYPFKAANVEVNSDKIILTAPDTRTRGMLIGRGGSNLRNIEEILKHFFPITEVKIA
jgi:N utilization substance protein A